MLAVLIRCHHSLHALFIFFYVHTEITILKIYKYIERYNAIYLLSLFHLSQRFVPFIIYNATSSEKLICLSVHYIPRPIQSLRTNPLPSSFLHHQFTQTPDETLVTLIWAPTVHRPPFQTPLNRKIRHPIFCPFPNVNDN